MAGLLESLQSFQQFTLALLRKVFGGVLDQTLGFLDEFADVLYQLLATTVLVGQVVEVGFHESSRDK